MNIDELRELSHHYGHMIVDLRRLACAAHGMGTQHDNPIMRGDYSECTRPYIKQMLQIVENYHSRAIRATFDNGKVQEPFGSFADSPECHGKTSVVNDIKQGETEMAEKSETITITPNYGGIRERMLQDAEAHVHMLAHTPNPNKETLDTVHSILSTLNVAAASIDSVEALNDFRDKLSAMTVEVGDRNNAIKEAGETD